MFESHSPRDATQAASAEAASAEAASAQAASTQLRHEGMMQLMAVWLSELSQSDPQLFERYHSLAERPSDPSVPGLLEQYHSAAERSSDQSDDDDDASSASAPNVDGDCQRRIADLASDNDDDDDDDESSGDSHEVHSGIDARMRDENDEDDEEWEKENTTHQGAAKPKARGNAARGGGGTKVTKGTKGTKGCEIPALTLTAFQAGTLLSMQLSYPQLHPSESYLSTKRVGDVGPKSLHIWLLPSNPDGSGPMHVHIKLKDLMRVAERDNPHQSHANKEPKKAGCVSGQVIKPGVNDSNPLALNTSGFKRWFGWMSTQNTKGDTIMAQSLKTDHAIDEFTSSMRKLVSLCDACEMGQVPDSWRVVSRNKNDTPPPNLPTTGGGARPGKRQRKSKPPPMANPTSLDGGDLIASLASGFSNRMPEAGAAAYQHLLRSMGLATVATTDTAAAAAATSTFVGIATPAVSIPQAITMATTPQMTHDIQQKIEQIKQLQQQVALHRFMVGAQNQPTASTPFQTVYGHSIEEQMAAVAAAAAAANSAHAQHPS